MLAHWLIDVDDFASPDSLSLFQKELPLEWIQQALDDTNKASLRRRKLPAELVVWLVVGIGLYRDRPITDVLDKLDLKLSNSLGESIAPSAIPQARKRLTAKPLEALFTLTAQHWAQTEDSDDTWFGLKLFSVDGTQFRTHDTPALAEHFQYVKHSKTRHTEYPVVRLCALCSLRSRLIHNVAFGPSYNGEESYAKQLISSATANSLTIFDRCYLGAELMINWQNQHGSSHWMTPIKSNTKYTIIEQLDEDGRDLIVEMNVSQHARKKDPHLPEKWQARLALYPEKEQPNHIKGVLTSLTDKKYDLQSLLDVYFERWEIENSYGEIKHDMLEDELLLRSQSIEGVEQEIWGILIAYNLVRLEISRIAKEAKVSPLRISFMMALRDIQDELMWCAIASPGSIPKKLRAMRERVKRYILPERKKRPKSRTVRISKTRYVVRSKHLN
ncbi:IS4 family transposase [Photobacterium rosenbergii]|uniref:IS4 family transposase n=2 Tax=Vibrionaceae TaxID=641 RepID=A0ABU3ZRA6_9GAMM|nr:IS4 family transposase [Photobacterium rosenbergii]MDV5172551.1 IS4 family transposase [Photobacterium rosenbergii]